MPSSTDRRPSAALLVAILALVVALGGTAYAAVQLPKNSVGSAQIKKDAVRSSDVKNRSLKAKDFKGQLDPSVVVVSTNPAVVPITAVVNDPADTVVRTMTLPAGTHYVQATVFARNLSGGLQAEPRCFLRSTGTTVAGGTPGFYQPLQPDAGTNIERVQFQLDAAIRFDAAGTVRVECNKGSAGQSVEVGASLSAIRVGSITAQ